MTVFTWIIGLLCIIVGIFTFVKGDSTQGWLWLVIGIAVGFVGMAWKNRRKKKG